MTQPVAERAYDHTKSLILSGGFAGGELLSEVTIADELGISRTPVHEAFLRLEGEKLLSLAPRRGAAVVPMAPDEARDVLEMREAIECSTARRALGAGALPSAVLAEMAANVDRQRELAAAGDEERFVELDSAFHAILIRASRNATALFFHELLRDRQHRLRHQLLQVGPQEVAGALAEHELMLAAAQRGDADELCRLISGHVRRHRGIL
ncbi:MAG: GntR family transcriptional regulator [Actinobacteria bacterium]|nr:GntR family transcriptional regulator [Actinomycetota bacterium]